MKKLNFVCVFVFLMCLSSVSISQSKDGKGLVRCESKIPTGDFKMLSASPGGVETQFYIQIKKGFRTNENYKTIAKHFRSKYCHENRLRVIFLKDKHQWKTWDANNPESVPLAIFFAGNNPPEQEGLFLYIRHSDKIEVVKLDL